MKSFGDYINHVDDAIVLRDPFVIAEIGVNHEGDRTLAERIINLAAEGGADAVKFQTYRADTLASRDSPAYWDIAKEPTTSQHDLFSKYDTFWKSDYEHLKGVADRAGVTFCSTPFDSESANFLAPLMPFIKISSSDITNKPFIKYLCQFSKPILLSTGAAYMWEIEEAVEWIQEEQNALVLLHCVLNYPTNEDHANLGAIQTLKQKFPECSIGYSDHTLPADMRTLEHAVLAGAQIVEKHFTHDKTLSGNDHYHAMDKKDLLQFRKNMKRAISLRGNGRLNNLRTQELSRANARRSLVLAKSIQAGAPLTPEHLTWKRPASGISPRHYDEILGRSVVLSLPADTILCWEHLGKRL